MRKEAEVKKPKLRFALPPAREVVTRDEQLRRFREIDEWRRAHFEKFKKTHPKVRDPY